MKASLQLPASLTALPPIGPTLAMVASVVAANVLMPYPLLPYISWGTPVITGTLLINELIQRRHGPKVAYRVAAVGFVCAFALSATLAPLRIATASATAFISSQLLDIGIFQRLRHGRWWQAPLLSSLLASALDTWLFFFLAFAGTPIPWWKMAVGDALVKMAVDGVMLLPYRLSVRPARPLANLG